MVALPLIHKCGARVTHSLGWTGAAVLGHPVALFSDSQTDDPVDRCPRCGAPLYDALVAGEFRPEQVKPTAPTARRHAAPGERQGVRTGAVKQLQKALSDMAARQQAKAPA